MKISKLFHWLYATLMFLPFVFFIPSVFYYGFNEHATNTETTTINYKYESNEVNTLDDLVVGNLYEIDLTHFLDTSVDDDYINFSSSYTFIIYDALMEVNTHQITYYSDDYTSINFNQNEITLDNDNYGSPIIGITIDSSTINNIYFYVVLGEYELNVTTTTPEQLFLYTDYNVIESVSVNTDDTITDKLNRSWNAIFDLPMFSWTKTTFVSGAFVYISGLFGVQANNPLNYLFAYFVSISICWLVFDVLLYVPNLAHRWLDKGAIE